MTGDGGGSGVTPSGAGIKPWSALSGSTFSARCNAAGSTSKVALPTGTYTFSNFAISGGGTAPSAFYFGAKLTCEGLLGAGSKYTNIEMVADSSTRKNDVPAQSTGASNQLQYIWITTPGAKIDGVKIVGTSQGHLYNGVQYNHVSNPTLSNATITGIPGNNGSPPGETFGVNFQGCTGTVTVHNVTVDGGDEGASGIGSNKSGAKYNIVNYLAINNKYSAGWASWEHTGTMNFHNFVMRNGARAFNAERLAGTVNFYNPIWDAPFSGHHDVNPTYDSGFTGGHLNFYFSSATAWRNFIAPRSIKKITATTNSKSVSLGLSKGSVIKVYVAGVLQKQSTYVQWS